MIQCVKAIRFVFLLSLGVLLAPEVVHAFAEGDTPAPASTKAANEGAADTVKLKFGDQTPEAAIRSFYTALATSDARTARHLLVSPRKMDEWVKVQARMSSSFRRLSAAAVEHLGDDGKALHVAVPAEFVLQKLATIKPTQTGGQAVWPIHPKFPTKLVRIDGHWKIDLHSSFRKPEDMIQQNTIFGRIAEYVGQIATDTEKGKLQTVAAVRAELKAQRAKMNEDLAKERE